MKEEEDEMVLGLDGWIITLAAALIADNGLAIIEEYPDLRTRLRAFVGDLDVSASYPWGQAVFNISKETTKKEFVSIEGIDDYSFRMATINLSGGQTNAIEFCTSMLNFPQLTNLLERYNASRTH